MPYAEADLLLCSWQSLFDFVLFYSIHFEDIQWSNTTRRKQLSLFV